MDKFSKNLSGLKFMKKAKKSEAKTEENTSKSIFNKHTMSFTASKSDTKK